MSVKVRDLDYVNPRQKLPSVALPPEVRARLGLGPSCSRGREAALPTEGGLRSSSETAVRLTSGIREQLALGGCSREVYVGAPNVALGELAISGKAGAGSDWANPRGHAFVRRGTAQQRRQSMRDAAKDKRDTLSLELGRRRGL
eukprot:TRINITY_DN34830_c1_g1_i1.p1 TRINITY_DN34830_c1_g1~~TRINITY_DN34830_c1_g1_i1.p1  ORF type:complete len:144 (-),score=22.64 TRINITY_DN34830_c1_g1_i1:251-682(-)